jgi:hypothetical protein
MPGIARGLSYQVAPILATPGHGSTWLLNHEIGKILKQIASYQTSLLTICARIIKPAVESSCNYSKTSSPVGS